MTCKHLDTCKRYITLWDYEETCLRVKAYDYPICPIIIRFGKKPPLDWERLRVMRKKKE